MPDLVVVLPQLSMISLACLTLMNQLVFKHSSGSRPLKLSAKAFSTGMPGRIRLKLIPLRPAGLACELGPIIYGDHLRQSPCLVSFSRTPTTLAPPREVPTSMAGHSRE